MTPAERAKYLIDRFSPGIWDNVPEERDDLTDAKQCAIIAVDEIINALEIAVAPEEIGFKLPSQGIDYQITGGLNYWEEVKKCIEAL